MENIDEQKIISEYLSLKQKRRDNNKSIVIRDDGSFLTSVVYTEPFFAKKVIDYFSPQFKVNDTFLDPCAGRMAFYNNLPEPKEFCEIQLEKDFLKYDKPVSWIFANFPWRGKVYSSLSEHALKLSNNVVSLVKFNTALGTNKRLNDANKHNMYLKEIIRIPWNMAGFTFPDGSVKSPEGFLLTILHWQKNWQNGSTWNEWKSK